MGKKEVIFCLFYFFVSTLLTIVHNEKLYKEAFIPDLIQILDQVASVKKNTLLVQYKNELRNLAAKKNLEMTTDCESIILRANDLGKDYTLALYNKPENFGCRLYGFKDDEWSKIDRVLTNFTWRALNVKGLLLELLDENKEIIDTIEKRFDISLLTTRKIGKKNIYSVQPTILIKNLKNYSNSLHIPSNIVLRKVGDSTATINLTLPVKNNSNPEAVYKDNEVDFPFIITPSAGFAGRWGAFNFYAISEHLKPSINYTITLKEKVKGISIPNGGQSFTLNVGGENYWEERMQFVIPVELELPEEILSVVKNIKASLLMK